jgi:hypothetical protein
MKSKPREGNDPWRKAWAILGRQCIGCGMVVTFERGRERYRYWEGLRFRQFQCKDCALTKEEDEDE